MMMIWSLCSGHNRQTANANKRFVGSTKTIVKNNRLNIINVGFNAKTKWLFALIIDNNHYNHNTTSAALTTVTRLTEYMYVSVCSIEKSCTNQLKGKETKIHFKT